MPEGCPSRDPVELTLNAGDIRGVACATFARLEIEVSERSVPHQMNDDQTRRRARPLQPDELDRQIIRMLRADGRRSNREIARRLGVPEATARYRVRRLIESGILNITASVEPEHLGYAMTTVISVQVEPERMNAVAAEIAAMPEVMWIAITAGAHDVMLMASFRDQEEMFSFLTDRLARIPGTLRTETSVALRILKRPHQWATDLALWIEDGALDTDDE
jgi:Lrp/AsnC family transcriptional regulator, regulator for asnA, asnC and gidA